jgi:hypothetical protein
VVVLVAVVEGEVQAQPVAVGETVNVTVGIGLHVETERLIVRQSATQITHREDRAEAQQAGPVGCGFLHSQHGSYQPTATIMYSGLATEMSEDWFESSS